MQNSERFDICACTPVTRNYSKEMPKRSSLKSVNKQDTKTLRKLEKLPILNEGNFQKLPLLNHPFGWDRHTAIIQPYSTLPRKKKEHERKIQYTNLRVAPNHSPVWPGDSKKRFPKFQLHNTSQLSSQTHHFPEVAPPKSWLDMAEEFHKPLPKASSNGHQKTRIEKSLRLIHGMGVFHG